MLEFILLVAGAILGWIASEFLSGIGGPGHSPIRKLGAEVRAHFRKAAPDEVRDVVHIGYFATEFYAIDGNGEQHFGQSTISAIFRDGAPNSPDDIADRILSKEKSMEAAREREVALALSGQSAEVGTGVWDGIGVGLLSYVRARDDREEFLHARVEFYKSRYAAFQATVVEIGTENRDDPNSIYQRHLKDRSPTNIAPFLARHVGVAVAVISSDGFMVATQRSDKVKVRAGEKDTSVVEGIEPTKDADSSGPITQIDIYKSIIRGCDEELGFKPRREDIKILGFGVDQRFYQFNFIAVVHANVPFASFGRRRNGNAKDSWETAHLVPVPFQIDAALDFVRTNRMWSTAMVAFYWALVSHFTRDGVEAKAAQIFNGTDCPR